MSTQQQAQKQLARGGGGWAWPTAGRHGSLSVSVNCMQTPCLEGRVNTLSLVDTSLLTRPAERGERRREKEREGEREVERGGEKGREGERRGEGGREVERGGEKGEEIIYRLKISYIFYI